MSPAVLSDIPSWHTLCRVPLILPSPYSRALAYIISKPRLSFSFPHPLPGHPGKDTHEGFRRLQWLKAGNPADSVSHLMGVFDKIRHPVLGHHHITLIHLGSGRLDCFLKCPSGVPTHCFLSCVSTMNTSKPRVQAQVRHLLVLRPPALHFFRQM